MSTTLPDSPGAFRTTAARWTSRRSTRIALLVACALATAATASAGPRHPTSMKPPSTGRDREAMPRAPRIIETVLPPEEAVTVRVERARPMRDKLATLRFLRENRGFIRSRLDRLRQVLERGPGQAAEIDPRFLAYRRLLAGVYAARDSVALADDVERRDLLQSITQLGELERRLDGLDQVLIDQRARLGVLQADFTGDQRTELIVVVSGYPWDAAVSGLTLALEDGVPRALALTDEHRQALLHGGALELFHGFVEPREQVVEVGIDGEAWPSGDAGYLSLEPLRDRLLLLHLDLSNLTPGQGAPAIRASTWLHEARIPFVDG